MQMGIEKPVESPANVDKATTHLTYTYMEWNFKDLPTVMENEIFFGKGILS